MSDSPRPYHTTKKYELQVHIFILFGIDKRIEYAYNKYELKVRISRKKTKCDER